MAEANPPRSARETLRLVLLQVLILIVIATAALSGPAPGGTPLYRVLGSGFVVCLILLVFLTLRTPLMVRVAVIVFLVFALAIGLGKGFVDIALAAVGATALGLALRRILPAPPPRVPVDDESGEV